MIDRELILKMIKWIKNELVIEIKESEEKKENENQNSKVSS